MCTLIKLKHFIEQHGNKAVISGNYIIMDTVVLLPNGKLTIEQDSITTLSQARDVLGY